MTWFCRRIRACWRRLAQGPFATRATPMKQLNGDIWIDLAPIGGEPVLCDVELTIGDHGEVKFQALVKGVTAAQINRLFAGNQLAWDEETSGTLRDGRKFEARIGAITSYSPTASNSMLIGGTLSNLSIVTAEGAEPHEWVFYLSNVKLYLGDCWSDYHDEHRRTLDSIEFSALDRKWRLTDSWHHKWSKVSRKELSSPILSGVLRTSYCKGDSDKDLTELAQDISHVLAFALSRSVNWVSYEVLSRDGKTIRGYSRSAWATAFTKHGYGPVENHAPHSLKVLLELALPVISRDRPWFSKTLGMLTQAQIADMLDVRCSILYTLTDRISSYIVKSTGKAEIDPELKARARKAEFVNELHQVLQKLSLANWTHDKTEAVIAEINRWNKMPSFVTKIQRACRQLDLPEPDKLLLRPRNDLLHDGELVSEDDDNIGHYLELDWMVLAMILRLFAYKGSYYHPKFGSSPVDLSSQLVTQNVGLPTESSGDAPASSSSS